MRRTSSATLALALMLALAACGDPLRDVERLSDVDLPEGGLAAAAVPPPEEQAEAPGLISRILGGTLTPGPSLPGAEDAAVDAAVSEALAGETVQAEVVPVAAPASAPDLPPVLESDPLAGTDAIPGDADMAAASQPTEPAPRRRGLFGLLNLAGAPVPLQADGPDAAQIAPGQVVSYGQIATVCGLQARDLGTPIAEASGYTVYDSDPGSVVQRPHYITGFGDNCARQVHAALAIFGDVGTHELVRYAQGTGDLPYSGTDTAYETIKAEMCRVPSGQPCGAALDRLARRTTFLTVYANFESNPEWAEILLSDGQVVAMDFEG